MTRALAALVVALSLGACHSRAEQGSTNAPSAIATDLAPPKPDGNPSSGTAGGSEHCHMRKLRGARSANKG